MYRCSVEQMEIGMFIFLYSSQQTADEKKPKSVRNSAPLPLLHILHNRTVNGINHFLAIVGIETDPSERAFQAITYLQTNLTEFT
jgi:hypothetical protein